MQYLSICLEKNNNDVIEGISDKLIKLSRDDIKLTVDNKNQGNIPLLICKIDEKYSKKSGHEYNVLIMNISAILAEHIIGKYESRLLNRVVNTNYCYFNALEKKQILRTVRELINSGDSALMKNILYHRRKNTIISELIEYFKGNNELILEGFVNFRLKEYHRDLEDIVDKAVDTFLMEREYNEFVKLLRYFVDMQEPRLGIIHIVPGVDGKYLLYDDGKREITEECILDLINDLPEKDINYDDLLISSLITLAPSKIIVHMNMSFVNKELVETIKSVFKGRVKLCNGCELCGKHMN